MSFWDDQEEDPLTELLNNPNSPLCDVLQEGNMLQELRTNNADLIRYLSQEKIIGELCEWSMTMKNEKHDNFNKISRIATETLTCGANYSQQLLKSATLEQFFKSFLSSKDEWDTICAGHFQRVFVHLLKNSNGSYLSRFPNIAEDLDNHLSVLAVSEFIIQLATEFNSSLPKQFVPILASYIDSSISKEDLTTAERIDLFPAIYTLRQIFTNGIQIKEIKDSFTSEEVIGKLTHAASTSHCKLTSIELYRLLSKIKEQSPLATGLVTKHTTSKNPSEINNSLISYEELNTDIEPKKAATLLCGKVHWALANKLLKRLAELPQADFLNLVSNETNLLKTIVENSNNGSITAQQIDLIRLLSKAGADLSSVPKEIVTKALLIGVRYGGEVPIGFQAEHKINAE